jgi:hypothetical protein
MKKPLLCTMVSMILIAAAMVPAASSQMLNPYEPYNALAAEPPTPYNLEQMPRCSRTFYVPCRWWAPYANYLPDVPPVWQPFPGPYGIPVPVP